MCTTSTTYDNFEKSNKAEELDTDLLRIYESTYIGLTISTAIIDLICIKWRQFARLLYPIEMLNFCLLFVLPYDQDLCYSHEDALLFFGFYLCVCLVCDLRSALIIQIIGLIAQTINHSFSIGGGYIARYFIRYSFMSLFLVITAFAIAILMNHVVQLQKRLRIQFDEHFNLINSMREGVIVLLN